MDLLREPVAPPIVYERLLFRAMEDDDGKPALGDRDLGVRVPTDVKPDANGEVHPRSKKGMSVAPDDPANLAMQHRPESLGGTGTKPIWKLDSGALPTTLEYEMTSKTHAVIQTAATTSIQAYRLALCSTQECWESQHV